MEIAALRKEPSTRGEKEKNNKKKMSGCDNDSRVTSDEVSSPKLLCCLTAMGADRGAETGSGWKYEEVAAKWSRRGNLDRSLILAVTPSCPPPPFFPSVPKADQMTPPIIWL